MQLGQLEVSVHARRVILGLGLTQPVVSPCARSCSTVRVAGLKILPQDASSVLNGTNERVLIGIIHDAQFHCEFGTFEPPMKKPQGFSRCGSPGSKIDCL
jgi:hypothetical protein